MDKCPLMVKPEYTMRTIRHRHCRPDIKTIESYYHEYICCPGQGNVLPNEEICGQRPPTNRVMNGKQAELNEFPWMALILYQNRITLKPKPKIICAGSLINHRYVLTAAHCVSIGYFPPDAEVKAVRLGEHDRSSDPDYIKLLNGKWHWAPPHLEVDVEEIIKHEYFNSNFQNDIALLRLQLPVR
ncbi:hypothetical protein M5D96_002044 [Drosophila gunungcola]|uniref:Peptidase S1 domain-containing protein n=2 Tax=Drosophila gunungcola TaxID=103775 RepID=A0A9P9YZM1_9MUSC|nr:hypothetical protein M5D96_002044 [Drosophila gunungcola]